MQRTSILDPHNGADRSACHVVPMLMLAVILFPTMGKTAHGMQEVPESSGEKIAAPSGALRTTVAPDIVDAELLPGWIDQRHPDLAADLELAGHEQWIAVDVDGATYDYVLTVTPVRDGEPVGPPSQPVPCDCNHAELMDLADEKIVVAVQVLQSTPAEDVMEQGGDVLPEPEPLPRSPVDDVVEPRRRLGPAGTAGVALMALGGLGTVAGISMVALGEWPRVPDNAWMTHVGRNYRPAGIASMIGGVAILAGGAVVYALRERLEGRSDARTVSLVPSIDGSIVLVGRF